MVSGTTVPTDTRGGNVRPSEGVVVVWGRGDVKR